MAIAMTSAQKWRGFGLKSHGKPRILEYIPKLCLEFFVVISFGREIIKATVVILYSRNKKTLKETKQ